MSKRKTTKGVKMSSTNGAAPEPRFNFSGKPRSWGKRWGDLQIRATEIELEINEAQADPPQPTGDGKTDNANLRAFQRNILDLMKEMKGVAGEQEKLLALVLEDVPREWLSDDAPAEIDWHDPVNLDYIQGECYTDVLTAMQGAMQSNSKN